MNDESTSQGRGVDIRLLKFVWTYIRPYQNLFWISAILMPLSTACALAQPYVIKIAIDLFLAKPRATSSSRALQTPVERLLGPILVRLGGGYGLVGIGELYLILIVAEFASFYGQFYLTNMLAQYSLSDLRLALFKQVERLPMAFFDRTPVGRLVSRMTTDIDSISEMFAAGSLTMFNDVLTLLGIITILFGSSPRLALWALCTIPPLLLIINFFRVRARVVYREIRDRLAAINAYLSEAISGMTVIQLFTREEVSRGEFDVLNMRSRDAQMMSNIYEAGLFSAVEALSSFTVAIVLWVGGGQTIRNIIGLGTLVAFVEYLKMFFMPLREISTKYTALQSALTSVERIEALMVEVPAIQSPLAPTRIANPRGSIVFENVSFEYRPGELVLRKLSFTVE
ncbi:MAG TPA: ABC transporter transmembrane domain-containing protein, partial [Candidatus Binataceae bacterium]|nr:ABC transporter transmembrane domain-containing protein [Candidatus Binataceae bacterium]